MRGNPAPKPKQVFKCHICETGFSRKPNLNRHLKTVHDKQFICHYSCHLCDTKYENESDLGTVYVAKRKNLDFLSFVMKSSFLLE